MKGDGGRNTPEAIDCQARPQRAASTADRAGMAGMSLHLITVMLAVAFTCAVLVLSLPMVEADEEG